MGASNASGQAGVIYKEDGPTTKIIRKALEDGASPRLLVLTLAREMDRFFEELGLSEAQRLQQEAEKGYKSV